MRRSAISRSEEATEALPDSAHLLPAPFAAKLERTLQSLPVGMKEEFRERVAARIGLGALVAQALIVAPSEWLARVQAAIAVTASADGTAGAAAVTWGLVSSRPRAI
jgi:hypothetical protein